MATPDELRERLRAKRDAQLQQQHYAEGVHAQARQAVQDLIVLGYDFPQILAHANGAVSADHLDAHYKAIGYFRRKASGVLPAPDPPSNFGSPRWLDNARNYTISLDDSEPDSASDEDDMQDAPSGAVPAAPPVENFSGARGALGAVGQPASEADSGPASGVHQMPPSHTAPQSHAAPSDHAAPPVDAMVSLPKGDRRESVSETAEHVAKPPVLAWASGAPAEVSAPTPIEAPAEQPAGSELWVGVPAESRAATTLPIAPPEVLAHSTGAPIETRAGAPAQALHETHEPVPAETHRPAPPAESDSPAAPAAAFASVSAPSPSPTPSTAVAHDTQSSAWVGGNPERSALSSIDTPQAGTPQTQAVAHAGPQAGPHAARQRVVSADVELRDVPMGDAEDQSELGESANQAGLGEAATTQAGPDGSDDESSSDDDASELKVSIQEELRRVQEQIRAVQERKQAKEAQREAEVAAQKRTAELSGLAAKRAVLIQARHRLNLPKLTSRVARLESKLKNAKELVLSAAVQLKEINAQSLELEKKEIELRNALAPAREIAFPEGALDGAGAGAGADASRGGASGVDAAHVDATEADAADETAVQRPPVKVLTADDSPLRMFGSWRLAPLGPRHWFSPSFNGRFIKDLDVREFCAVELTGDACVDRDCEYVHFRDFEVAPGLVVEYMATRGILRPGYREGLVGAVRTHLAGPDASPEQLAAAVVGFRRQYDASQVLDWDAWTVDRPL